MPPNPELDLVEDPLHQAYEKAWQRVVDEQAALEGDPRKAARRNRLREMEARITAVLDDLDSQADELVQGAMRQAYSLGATSSTTSVSELVWSTIHQEAVEELALSLFTDLLEATKGVRSSTKSLVRSIGRDAALHSTIAGGTATQAAAEMRKRLAAEGIFSVRYRDGSRHGLKEYSQVAIRTKTAVAYNTGTLNAHPEVRYWEIFDGPQCGLTYHDDPNAAMGMIVERSVAESFPISHPNCRRAFGPRPDIVSQEEIDALKGDPNYVGSGQTTVGQRAAQIAQDRSNRRASRSSRVRHPRSDGSRLQSARPANSADSRRAKKLIDEAVYSGDPYPTVRTDQLGFRYVEGSPGEYPFSYAEATSLETLRKPPVIEQFSPSDLKTVQKDVRADFVQELSLFDADGVTDLIDPGDWDELQRLLNQNPIVVRKGGENWLVDGHHRATADLIRQGDGKFGARVIDLDPPKPVPGIGRSVAEIDAEIAELGVKLRKAPGGGARARIKRKIAALEAEKARVPRVDPAEIAAIERRVSDHDAALNELADKLRKAPGGRARSKIKVQISEVEALRNADLADLERLRGGHPLPPRDPPPIKPTTDPVVPKPEPKPLVDFSGIPDLATIRKDHFGWTNVPAMKEQMRLKLSRIPDVDEILRRRPGWTRRVAERERQKLVNSVLADYPNVKPPAGIRFIDPDGVSPPPIVKPAPKPASPPPPAAQAERFTRASAAERIDLVRRELSSTLPAKEASRVSLTGPLSRALSAAAEADPGLRRRWPQFMEHVGGKTYPDFKRMRDGGPDAIGFIRDAEAVVRTSAGIPLRKKLADTLAEAALDTSGIDDWLASLTDEVSNIAMDKVMDLSGHSTGKASKEWFRKVLSPEVVDEWRTTRMTISPDRVDRAYYEGNWKLISLEKGGRARTTVHEAAHGLEQELPGWRQAALDFRGYRKGDEKLSEIYQGSGEMGWKDDFISHYMGKHYGSRATEIISMGFEEMYANPGKFLAKDPEYFWFIVGLATGRLP